MSRQHFVRVGLMGHVGRFTSVDAVAYPRASRVIVRTSRGLETGEVLGPAEESAARGAGDGSILRGMTVEDELLISRLEKNRQKALEACTQRLAERRISATLFDVEHLFDGRSLFFYFLGEVTPEIEAITTELAEVYDAAAEFRKFSETLATGCGPGCGTEEAAGHGGCTLCATACAVAGACGTKRR
ncbi:MAG TPA: PSP1 C-terminal domain-containing protein [Pirellulales bacterium]|nr:PSP1 C-terminal domain-containing protein [Pirellulales bacterium]